MLFTRFAIPLLALAASALATSSPSIRISHLSKRLSVSAEAHISTALETATSQIKGLGIEIHEALEGVNAKDTTAVVDAVQELLTDFHASLTVLASACVSVTRRSLVERHRVDINTLAQLVADLLNTSIATLKPIQDLIKANPALGPLLTPFLNPINAQLVLILNGLLAAVAGLLNIVLSLLDVTAAPLLRRLGFSPILSLLNL
ncbi:hypothetical protein JCM5353_005922 [Sporobolomyces roseus]